MTFDEWMKRHMENFGDSLSYRPSARVVWECATKAEREACAKVADSEAATWAYAPDAREPCENIAAAIRAR